MPVKPMRVGVVGSGLISGIYLKNMSTRFDILQVKGVASAHPENAKRKADEFGLPAWTVGKDHHNRRLIGSRVYLRVLRYAYESGIVVVVVEVVVVVVPVKT